MFHLTSDLTPDPFPIGETHLDPTCMYWWAMAMDEGREVTMCIH